MAEAKSHNLGKIGELIAKKYLESAGYQIIASNLKLGNLEIDLIAGHQGWLYFFEIKTNALNFNYQPSNNLISKRQIDNLKRATHIYATKERVAWEKIRFDLLAISISKNTNKATIRRFGNIFS